MLQKSSHNDIGDDDEGVSANVRNLVSLFEKRRKGTKSTYQPPRPDDEDAKCENVIISPPLEFEDSLHLTSSSSSSSVTVSCKPRSRTDFISDILKLGGAGGGEETGAGAGEGEGEQFLSQDHASLFSLLSHAAATAARVRGEQLVSAWVQLRQLEQAGYLQLRDPGAAQLLARLVLRTLGTMR